ncbi:hypothetical protein PPACK8108_LOCUS16667 [Phakopsora pachyrhizi]|uniref:Piwi domain-containing protein n=1 Tax=Phakopsora pachyrhizi TaxID=170000 RepID=A0AAV0BAG0_PHAPC|nr:hypothetical protein PPACK8108_LOCUS16667 [Phakopsora pachyrhizi]
MRAHSAAATNSGVYLPINCSAALKVLKSSESAVGFKAVVFIFYFKIHMDRFESHSNDADRSGISQPGTIVDKSQANLNSTSYPTRYVVQRDETNHTVDDPQNIANSVCSASQIATKSVGIAIPAYYANLVATWAKKWDILDENCSTVFTTNSGT